MIEKIITIYLDKKNEKYNDIAIDIEKDVDNDDRLILKHNKYGDYILDKDDLKEMCRVFKIKIDE